MRIPGKRLLLSLAMAGIIASCSKETTILQWMPHMTSTANLKPQEGYEAFGDGAAVRLPPEGTLPRGFTRYHYTDAEVAGRELSNPIPLNETTLRRGQKIYNTYCYVCHGSEGNGDGPVVPPYPIPKSLHSEQMRAWKDGHIFHVITRGQGVMPSYAQQISPDDRWALIHYVRALQRSQNPSEADQAAFDKAKAK